MSWDEQIVSSPGPHASVIREIDEDRPSSQQMSSKYDLRASARYPSKPAPTTWVDQDRSGDYDPDGPVVLQPSPFNKRRPSSSLYEDQSTEGTIKKPKTNSWQWGRYTGLCFPITFKLSSTKGRDVLMNYGSSLNNWPGVCSDSSDSELNGFWSAAADSSVTSQNTSSDSSAPYYLRKRWVSVSDRDGDSGGCGVDQLGQISLGHPAARGCKACLEIGISCTLLQEGSSYPCDTCVQDAIECELVIQPSQKRPCESCRRRRIVCSYREEGDHTLPCSQCTASSLKCVAGPRTGRTRTGPSLDQDPSELLKLLLGSRRRFLSCTECRRSKKKCSLLRKNEDLPCKSCCQQGSSCTFEPLGLTNNKTNKIDKVPESDDTRMQMHGPRAGGQKTPDQISEDQPVYKPPIAKIKTITTRFTHPIRFNYRSSDKTEPPICHWCNDSLYGLLGLAETRVEVIDYQDGQGYIEIGGGHTATGHLPSRMCDSCTLHRFMVAACRRHEMVPIPGTDAEEFDFSCVKNYLVAGKASSVAPPPPFEWCSVCPSPAFYACRKPVHVDRLGDMAAALLGNEPGCGLLLCERCTVTMACDHDGRLDGLLDGLRTRANGEDGNGNVVLRADADFLHPAGELLRRVGMGENRTRLIK